MSKDTFTITFGDQAENHVGMQKIGKLSQSGFKYKTLKKIYKRMKKVKEMKVELIKLHRYIEKDKKDKKIDKSNKACLLVIRGFADGMKDELYREQKKLIYDKKALMRGKVVNKRARYNICFGDSDQEPDYKHGKGRIVSYKNVPFLQSLKNKLNEEFKEDLGELKDLVAEGNHYYDIKKTGISLHGDSERRKVIAIRLGTTFPLHYQWFQSGNSIGERFTINLNHGDIYIMSEKAVGYDWKKRKILTLRHGAGNIN